MILKERINALSLLGEQLNKLIAKEGDEESIERFQALLIKAEQYNPWFSQQFLKTAFENIIAMLDKAALENWTNSYPDNKWIESNIRVGVIMAGNIPMVGFHDFLSILISGKSFIGKLSSNDQFLLPYIADILISIEKRFADKIRFEDHLMKDFDAVIATGSNNSSRYFDYYFGKYPHIIRKNRNSVAILNGKENNIDLENLAKDVFYYYGLGCRNVSKILLPIGYEIPTILDAFQSYDYMSMHTKYINNYEYNKSLMLINKQVHFDNGFLLMTENAAISSPAAVLHYEFYTDYESEIRRLNIRNDSIQCVISGEKDINNAVLFGNSQVPGLMEYADNVDVISFLDAL